jgi:hypothetical protein
MEKKLHLPTLNIYKLYNKSNSKVISSLSIKKRTLKPKINSSSNNSFMKMSEVIEILIAKAYHKQRMKSLS